MISSSAFVTILSEADDVLSVRQHAVHRKMFKQRFFLQTIPLLVRTKGGVDRGAEGGDEEEKEEEADEEGQRRSEQHRLNALASMLPHLPQQALLSELPVILPVLVKV